MKLIHQILFSSADRYADKEAVRDPHGFMTYESLCTQVLTLASGLISIGASRRSRLLTILPNSIDFFKSHFSALVAGCISVPCDFAVTFHQFEQIIHNCQPEVVITNRAVFNRLATIFQKARLRAVVLTDGLLDSQIDDIRILSFEELLEQGNGNFSIPDWNSQEISTIMYTTGSSGMPKGVSLTHFNVLSALNNICKFVGYTSNDREVIILPLSHNFGLGHAYCNFMNGGAVYTEHGLTKVKRVFKAIQDFSATGFPGTPLGFGLLMDRFGPILREKLQGLRFIVINSAPMPSERTRQLQELLPNVNIMVYYGLTEASRSAFISLTKMGPAYYHSVGCSMNKVNISIKDSKGKNLSQGEEGEVVIEGPIVTPGYWNQTKETSKALKNRCLFTGDLGHLDKSGFLYITGRLKQMINVGGLKLNPREVEKILTRFSGVRDAGVVGISELDGFTGESVVAALVLENHDTFSFQDCEKFCLQHLEKYKVPRHFFVFNSILRAETGKLKRLALLEQVKKALKNNNQKVDVC